MCCPGSKDLPGGHSCCDTGPPELLTAGVKPHSHCCALLDVSTQIPEFGAAELGQSGVVPVTAQAGEQYSCSLTPERKWD